MKAESVKWDDIKVGQTYWEVNRDYSGIKEHEKYKVSPIKIKNKTMRFLDVIIDRSVCSYGKSHSLYKTEEEAKIVAGLVKKEEKVIPYKAEPNNPEKNFFVEYHSEIDGWDKQVTAEIYDTSLQESHKKYPPKEKSLKLKTKKVISRFTGFLKS